MNDIGYSRYEGPEDLHPFDCEEEENEDSIMDLLIKMKKALDEIDRLREEQI